MTLLSSFSGGSSSARPVHTAPSFVASFRCDSDRLNTYTSAPQYARIWIATCADAPNP